jgi:hypothetical protein
VRASAAEQFAENPVFDGPAPEGASDSEELTASLKRCPDTKLLFFQPLKRCPDTKREFFSTVKPKFVATACGTAEEAAEKVSCMSQSHLSG